ncbi:MAG: exodeoxyribonuclease VII large subunit, partial [Candidatus Eremiobacterales bacterium]
MRSLFEAPPVGVGELCRQIKRALEGAFPQRVRVVGEISGCNVNRASGHAYFTLKDAQASIACVCLGDRLSQIDVALPLPDGLQVEIRGRVATYIPQSKYQISVDDIVPVGRGELHRRFEQLKQQLSREGLFARERKRPLPEFVRRVAIVTSREGAALADFLTTCRRRGAHIEVLVVHTPVQGEASATRVAMAIRRASTLPVDVVVVARGGGSLEDLWAFNTEVVAREIAACARPVISAVGHETDVTIADFVADVRAATPTAAAELVSPDRARLLKSLAASETRLIGSVRRAHFGLQNRV